MKGKTRITLNRETLRQLLEEHISPTMLGEHGLVEWSIKRNSSVEAVIQPKKQAPEPALEPGP